MKRLRSPNGTPITEDDYRRCMLGLHTQPRPFATMKVELYQAALAPHQVTYVCEDCAERRLNSYRDIFNFVEVTPVGRVKK